MDVHDGKRNDNYLISRANLIPKPDGPGYVGVAATGRVYRVEPTGEVVTLAGRVSKKNVVPYHFGTAVKTADLWDAQTEMIGEFEDDVLFSHPTDAAFDAFDSSILYVADSGNHRIARIDLKQQRVTTFAGSPGRSGFRDGESSRARFNEPWSIVTDPSTGTLYVADKSNHAIRKIDRSGLVSTMLGGRKVPKRKRIKADINRNPNAWRPKSEPLDKATLVYPHVVRIDSKGNLVVGENWTSAIRRVNLGSNTIDRLHLLGTKPGRIMWLDVDRKGNVGPIDHILFVEATGKRNDVVHRFDPVSGQVTPAHLGLPQFPGKDSGFGEGGSTPFPLTVAIDDEEARFAIVSSYRGSVSVFRPLPGDHPPVDQQAYENGKIVYMTGTVAGFPFGSRPAFSSLHGRDGFSRLSTVPSFDDLTQRDDVNLGRYIQTGMEGLVPRPEITGNDLRDLIYFVRRTAVDGRVGPTDLTPLSDDTVPPRIEAVAVSRTDESTFRIRWRTDEKSIGYVRYGPDKNYGLSSSIEAAYALDHEVVLLDIPPDKGFSFSIMSKDLSGNLRSGPATVLQGGLVKPDGSSPVVSDVTLERLSPGRVLVSWRSNEPTDATVRLKSANGEDRVQRRHSFSIHSQMILGGLSVTSGYTIEVSGKDVWGRGSNTLTVPFDSRL